MIVIFLERVEGIGRYAHAAYTDRRARSERVHGERGLDPLPPAPSTAVDAGMPKLIPNRTRVTAAGKSQLIDEQSAREHERAALSVAHMRSPEGGSSRAAPDFDE